MIDGLTERQRRFAELHCPWALIKKPFTIKEISEYLNLTRQTIYNLIRKNKLKSFHVTKNTRRISNIAIINYLILIYH